MEDVATTVRDLRDVLVPDLPDERRVSQAGRIKSEHSLAYADATRSLQRRPRRTTPSCGPGIRNCWSPAHRGRGATSADRVSSAPTTLGEPMTDTTYESTAALRELAALLDEAASAYDGQPPLTAVEGVRSMLHLLSAATEHVLEADEERPVFSRIVSPHAQGPR